MLNPLKAIQRMQRHREETHCPQDHELEGTDCPICTYLTTEENRQKRTWRQKRKLRAVLLMGGACSDCGQTFPDNLEVFDFDHVGEKKANVGELLNKARWSTILRELKQCELVCSNCHRIRTKQKMVVRYNGLYETMGLG